MLHSLIDASLNEQQVRELIADVAQKVAETHCREYGCDTGETIALFRTVTTVLAERLKEVTQGTSATPTSRSAPQDTIAAPAPYMGREERAVIEARNLTR